MKKQISKSRAVCMLLIFLFVILSAVNVLAQEKNKQTTIDKDLIILLKDISPNARFYPVEIDGIKMEVIAVEASDGTIRTAFNTCQSCYNSGAGYYIQKGNKLECQNCKSQFGMSQIEVLTRGCNPIPISQENKKVDNEKIVISKEFLKKGKIYFVKWKY
jgi:uncharacterized membrane protein